MAEPRTDTVSYEHDYREFQGPIVHRDATRDLPWIDYFWSGFCPRCLSRLSWNRTLCFADELEDQCSECLTAWREPESEAP